MESMRSRSSSRIERIRQLECEREREREREAMQETIKRLTSTGVESTHELERETMQEPVSTTPSRTGNQKSTGGKKGGIKKKSAGKGESMDEGDSAAGALFVISIVASYAVKYGELLFDLPFDAEAAPTAALAFIFIPSLLNCAKWQARSKGSGAFDMF